VLPSRVKPGKSRQIAANEKAGFRAFRIQAHAIAVALDPQAVAVILDLVEPIRAAGDLDAASGNAKLKRLKHAPEMGA